VYLEQTNSGYVPGSAKYFRGNSASLQNIRPEARGHFAKELGESAGLAKRVGTNCPPRRCHSTHLEPLLHV